MSLLRCLVLLFALFLAPPLRLQGGEEGKVRLLMVGNSFAIDATHYLPGLAKAGGKELTLQRAAVGGCSLERHANGIAAYEADPASKEGRIYTSFRPSQGAKSLREALEMGQWDYVSIQQVSTLSFKEASYEPYAGTIVEYIRRYAPGAKLLVHQTWAYREDHVFYKEPSFTPLEMYKGLSAAYVKLAERYSAEIVPVGLAFQTARATERWRFRYPDKAFDYTNPAEGALPRQEGSLNVGWHWRKASKEKQGEGRENKRFFRLDAYHANVHGRYLGACVFYEVLFGESAVGNTFVPEGVAPGDAAMLQEIARSAVQEYRKRPEVLLTADLVYTPGQGEVRTAAQPALP